MLNLWPFYHFTFKCDLDLQPTWTNVTSSLQGHQLCQIILKSMHKCKSYGSDKLNLWPFYHLTFKCDLDLQPTWANVSNGTSTPRGHLWLAVKWTVTMTMPNDVAIHPQMYKLWPGQIWQMRAHRHVQTSNWNCNSYVSLTPNRLDKSTDNLLLSMDVIEIIHGIPVLGHDICDSYKQPLLSPSIHWTFISTSL